MIRRLVPLLAVALLALPADGETRRFFAPLLAGLRDTLRAAP